MAGTEAAMGVDVVAVEVPSNAVVTSAGGMEEVAEDINDLMDTNLLV